MNPPVQRPKPDFRNADSRPDFDTVPHKAAISLRALAVRPSKARCIALRLLDNVDKLRLFHLPGDYAERLGLFLNLV